MIKNKIMNLLRKGNDTMKLRKMAMVFAVASMALVGGVACGVSDKDTAKTEKVEIAENKEESSVEETTEEVVEEATKEEVKETTKEEVKKEQTKEEVKKEQTSNTDKKKEENVKTEKPSKGNSNNTSSANKPSTGNGTTTNSVNKPSTGNGTANKPSTGNSNNNNPNTNKPSNSGVNNKPSTKPSTPVKPVHTHTWEEVTTTVYHEEQGHYENVVVKEAWTEKKPVYETQARDICNSCNADLTGTNIAQHVKEHMINGTDKGGHRTEYKKVQVGTETINHPAVTERKWVIDKAAWTEKVVTGYKCSDCGATK